MTDSGKIVKGHASVLFSGGTDSALAAVEMLKQCRKVTLLTFNPGFILFVGNSKVHAETLQRKYGADRVEHKLLDNSKATNKILFGNLKHDLRKYRFDMTALVCLGCRLSMHTRAIIHNLEEGIPIIADGSIRKQSAIPEQMDSVIRRNRNWYFQEYGITQVSPIYEENNSDLKLFEAGISKKRNLKRQFILFDTQATCPFGVSADVYARMFYRPLMGGDTEKEAEEYSREKYPEMKKYIEEYFAKKRQPLEELIINLRKKE